MIVPLVVIASLVLAASSCAATSPGASARAPRAATSAAPAAGAASASALDDVVAGLVEFENRASKYGADEWNLVLGYANFRQGRSQEAETLLAKALPKFPLVADSILFFRAVAAEKLGNTEAALALLDELKNDHADSVWDAEAKLERARLLVAAGRPNEARTTLEELRRRGDPQHALEASILAIEAQIAEGEGDAAAAALRSLAISADGEAMLAELAPLMAEVKRRFGIDVAAWLAEPAQQMRLAQSFAASSQWDDAVGRLEPLLKNGQLGNAMEAEATWLLARGCRWTRRYDDAIRLMEGLLANPAAAGFADSVRNTLATTYTKRNDYDKAIALRRRMMEGAPPNSARAAEMAYKIAFLVMDEGKYTEAIPLWRQALAMRGAGKRENAEWYLAWSQYMAGQHDEAVTLLDGMLKGRNRRDDIHDRLLYWKGRVLEKQGKAEAAREMFRGVIGEHPNGYYAELAARRLKGDKRATAEFWRASGAGGGASAMRGGAVSVSGASHLARAAFFDKLGLHEEAAREIRANGGGGSDVLVLAARNFAHDVAYRVAAGAGRGGQGGEPEPGDLLWEAGYPRAYDPLMARLTRGSTVDPRFIWAIMRNESTFRPEVVSPAGAIGLLQLMPSTAAKLAAAIGKPSVSRRDLFRPATNVALGTAYLQQIAAMFPGNHAAWAASYNAGEDAVERWIANGKLHDIEEWIEEIPYDETNLYVKKVMLSFWKYQKLYSR